MGNFHFPLRNGDLWKSIHTLNEEFLELSQIFEHYWMPTRKLAALVDGVNKDPDTFSKCFHCYFGHFCDTEPPHGIVVHEEYVPQKSELSNCVLGYLCDHFIFITECSNCKLIHFLVNVCMCHNLRQDKVLRSSKSNSKVLSLVLFQLSYV